MSAIGCGFNNRKPLKVLQLTCKQHLRLNGLIIRWSQVRVLTGSPYPYFPISYQGWPEQAPFDGIIVTAAPEEIPQELVAQLKPGGLMILPVGPRAGGQDLLVLDKDAEGGVSTKQSFPVRFVPMVHENQQKN